MPVYNVCTYRYIYIHTQSQHRNNHVCIYIKHYSSQKKETEKGNKTYMYVAIYIRECTCTS